MADQGYIGKALRRLAGLPANDLRLKEKPGVRYFM
jgi:hypothetical protein